jgi:uncharacterized membrane protein YhaH (DUF805 family)
MHGEAKATKRAKDATSVWYETLDIKSRIERNPYGMVAGAVTIGFVLGGGLFSRVAARILGAGLRLGLMAAVPVIEKALVQTIIGSKLDKKLDNKKGS